MDTRILALMIVVIGFAVLAAWVFWPKNRERLEAHGRIVLDSEPTTNDEGEHQ